MPKRSPLSLAEANPAIAALWHPTKNHPLTPADISPFNKKPVFWLCENGHETKTSSFSRVKGHACRQCPQLRGRPGHNLAESLPELAKEWHPTLNGDLTPSHVTPKSSARVFWLCSAGHSYDSIVANRAAGNGCRFCNRNALSPEHNLAVKNPDLASEWHPTLNGDLTPFDVTPLSTKLVYWLCKSGHVIHKSPCSRKSWPGASSNYAGCGVCSGHVRTETNTLAALYPEIAALWHPTGNGTLSPDAVSPSSPLQVVWRCKEKGHAFSKTVDSFVRRSTSCPKCSRKVATPETSIVVTHPGLLAEWDYEKNASTLPEQVLSGSGKPVWWKCAKGHSWHKAPAVRTSKYKPGNCPSCPAHTSGPEARLAKLLAYVMNVDFDHPAIMAGGKRRLCDIVVPDKRLVIEYDGCYWHKGREKRVSDLAKTKALQAEGWRVIRVRERPLRALTDHDVLIDVYDVASAFSQLCSKLRISAKERDKAFRMEKAELN